MNIKKTLEYLKLTEGVDFVLTESAFDMLPKTRTVTTPAVYDEQMNVVTEATETEEQYTPEAPSAEAMAEAWKQVQLSEQDIVMLIEEYLKDKSALRDPEEDSLNIVEGRIHTWGFTNIPCPSVDELLALIPALQAKADMNGKLAQIAELEAQVTPRRVREAVLSGDKSFIESIDAQIAAIRATL